MPQHVQKELALLGASVRINVHTQRRARALQKVFCEPFEALEVNRAQLCHSVLNYARSFAEVLELLLEALDELGLVFRRSMPFIGLLHHVA